jgi:hypothetical protein
MPDIYTQAGMQGNLVITAPNPPVFVSAVRPEASQAAPIGAAPASPPPARRPTAAAGQPVGVSSGTVPAPPPAHDNPNH